jgi:hypothetical protein
MLVLRSLFIPELPLLLPAPPPGLEQRKHFGNHEWRLMNLRYSLRTCAHTHTYVLISTRTLSHLRKQLTFSFWTQWNEKMKNPWSEFKNVNKYAIATDSWLRYKKPKVHVNPNRNTNTMAPFNQALKIQKVSNNILEKLRLQA